MTGVIPEEVVMKLLQALNLAGGTTGWGLTYSKQPDSPGNCVTVYGTTPVITGQVMRPDSNEIIQHFGILMRVRGVDYATGYLKGMEIQEALRAVKRYPITVRSIPVMIHAMALAMGLVWITEEETAKRQVFTINYLTPITRN